MITRTALLGILRALAPYLIGAAILAYGAVGVIAYNKGVDNCLNRQAAYALEEEQKKNDKLREKAIRDREIAEQQVGKLKDIQGERNEVIQNSAPPIGCRPDPEWLQYIGAEALPRSDG